MGDMFPPRLGHHQGLT